VTSAVELGELYKRRSCGTCRLCCKLVATWEVGTGPLGEPYDFRKPRGVWCTHAGPGGCAIYTSPAKPWTCRVWACVWRMGTGSEEHRPDRVHFVPSLEELDGETHLVLYTDRVPYSRTLQRWIDAYRESDQVAAVMVVEPSGARQRWHQVHGHQRMTREPGDCRMPSEPARVDPEREALREMLGEEAVLAPAINLAELQAAMLREQTDTGAPILSWSQFVRERSVRAAAPRTANEGESSVGE
jgi:hypothetical protein